MTGPQTHTDQTPFTSGGIWKSREIGGLEPSGLEF